ncbi:MULTISPECIES: phosphoribosyltransferase [unclassified Chelatococcus]|uniref:phosphoribosyltransferase n=1 Tax=unclassified Chelatococcus TaxID=2638111 RepID=UPI0002E451E4|nr:MULTISPECIES: phosphoribosyltransferase family protein [unclassified Chelatococcus]ALA20507.1 phosphoribosyltransferase [Chelatococcus sp. CO-6]
MPFLNRMEAGRRLAKALAGWRDEDPVVLALPRGGVPVAAEIAAAFAAPLDLVLVRKLGVPRQPELAMGAVVDGAEPITVRNEDVIAGAQIAPADFEAVRARELAEIERRRRFYLGSRPPVRVEGRCAIVVDDGIATGATVRAALRAIRRRAPARLVLATPVAPRDVVADLSDEADAVVCLETPEPFWAVGAAYLDFDQVEDEAVIATLARFPPDEGSARSSAPQP